MAKPFLMQPVNWERAEDCKNFHCSTIIYTHAVIAVYLLPSISSGNRTPESLGGWGWGTTGGGTQDAITLCPLHVVGTDSGVTVPFLKDILWQAKLHVRPLQCDIPEDRLKALNKEAKVVNCQVCVFLLLCTSSSM